MFILFVVEWARPVVVTQHPLDEGSTLFWGIVPKILEHFFELCHGGRGKLVSPFGHPILNLSAASVEYLSLLGDVPVSRE
jgi:hypothetical protein